MRSSTASQANEMATQACNPAVLIATRADINLAAYRAVAFNDSSIHLAASVLQKMRQCRHAFLRLLEDPRQVIYGVTSGFGQYATHRYTPDERRLHAARAPLIQAAAFGTPLPERVVRGIVLSRLANMVEGHAAVRPELALAVCAMLDKPIPAVSAQGHGASGEILALSALFGHLGLELRLQEKEALTLINGSPCAGALLADATLLGEARLALCIEAAAMAAAAFRAPAQHFLPELGELWEAPAEHEVLTVMQPLIGDVLDMSPSIQAPVSFRIIPRVLGRLRHAVWQAASQASSALCAVTDNPVYLAPDATHPAGRICSNGGFHNPHAAAALDALTAAYADTAVMMERLASRLLDDRLTGLPDPGPGNDRDLTCVAMSALGHAEEARQAAQHSLLPGSESGGFGRSDIVTPTFAAWNKQEAAARSLLSTGACLTLIAVRTWERRGITVPPSSPLRVLLDLVRPLIPSPGQTLRPGIVCEAMLTALERRVRQTIRVPVASAFRAAAASPCSTPSENAHDSHLGLQ